MSTPKSAQAPSPFEIPPLLTRDSRSGPSSQVGWSQTALASPGAKKLHPPGGTQVSPLPSFSSAWSPELSPCPSHLSSACVSVCLFSLLPGFGLPAVPICPHSPFPSFPPPLPSPLLCSPMKCRADISWDLQFGWGLRSSSLLGLRPRPGPSHFTSQLCLKEPIQSSPPEAAGFRDVVALCEIQAGPPPYLPNGGARVVCFPHSVQGASARDF